MTLSPNLKEAFEILKLRYGSHTAAAKALGYTREHYRLLRNSRHPISERASIAILSKASEDVISKSLPASHGIEPDGHALP